jgi:hypothetical protein
MKALNEKKNTQMNAAMGWIVPSHPTNENTKTI